ncbi:MAG: hypothetical protein EBT02_01570 [Planctomycetia bacterium]|nr:hypothetical protein [Planctomycetia bacterium]
MDWQLLFNLIGTAIMATIGWFARQLWDSVKELKEDIKNIQVDLPTNYMRKVDIDAQFNKLELSLQRILDKLDQKADK